MTGDGDDAAVCGSDVVYAVTVASGVPDAHRRTTRLGARTPRTHDDDDDDDDDDYDYDAHHAVGGRVSSDERESYVAPHACATHECDDDDDDDRARCGAPRSRDDDDDDDDDDDADDDDARGNADRG